MRERAHKLGGFVALNASGSPGASSETNAKGFTVTVRFPLHTITQSKHSKQDMQDKPP
jgi:hypothetical protein